MMVLCDASHGSPVLDGPNSAISLMQVLTQPKGLNKIDGKIPSFGKSSDEIADSSIPLL